MLSFHVPFSRHMRVSTELASINPDLQMKYDFCNPLDTRIGPTSMPLASAGGSGQSLRGDWRLSSSLATGGLATDVNALVIDADRCDFASDAAAAGAVIIASGNFVAGVDVASVDAIVFVFFPSGKNADKQKHMPLNACTDNVQSPLTSLLFTPPVQSHQISWRRREARSMLKLLQTVHMKCRAWIETFTTLVCTRPGRQNLKLHVEPTHQNVDKHSPN